MSERFVRGWKVSPQKLHALVGPKGLKTKEVLASKANAKCLNDVVMTLGDGDEKDGQKLAELALNAIATGKLASAHAYRYARVLELVLNHVARPLATKYVGRWSEPQDQILLQHTYHVPNNTFGRWNPLLKACKLPKLAKLWAEPNVQFPFSVSRKAKPIDWPVWTCMPAEVLPALAAELASVTKERLDAIPAKLLADNGQYVEECRAELGSGLARLREWVDKARASEKKEGAGWSKEGNALVLLMDGDQ